MFTIVNGLPANILGIVVSGKTTEKDYALLNPLLEKHKMERGSIKLFFEIDDFDYTVKAAWEDLKTGLHYWRDIKAVAMVSDKKWLEKTVEAFGAIIPGMDIKGFPLEERAGALAWLKNQKG